MLGEAAIQSRSEGRRTMVQHFSRAGRRLLGMVWFPLCLALGVPAAAQDHRSWKDYGGGPDSSKYVALDQITKANVSQLQVAWTYSTGDNNAYLFNPIIVDNVMYVLARNNSMIAMDAATGKEIWIHENLRGIAGRGINYWESKDRKD